jgi:hypothetical protein
MIKVAAFVNGECRGLHLRSMWKVSDIVRIDSFLLMRIIERLVSKFMIHKGCS